MGNLIDELLALLNLETLEVNLFRGDSRDVGGRSVFGGQVVAQALVAAQRTVDASRLCHSLHAYFLRPGDMKTPIIYEVDRQRDGGSFTTRRVVAIQHGQPIFNLAASFQVKEPGAEHQADEMPSVPQPETLMSEAELRRRVVQFVPEKYRDTFLQPRPVEMRPINPTNPFNPVKTDPSKAVWLKADGVMEADPRLHQAVLAYASDFHLLGTCMLPHAMSFVQPHVQAASLDHTIWFHGEFRADDWLLYAMDSPWAANARGLNRGRVFARDGRLVATVMQEGLIRDRSSVK